MHIHKMKLNAKPFEKIKQGTKTIELRLFDEKRQRVMVDDQIIFEHRDTKEELVTMVKAIHRFSSFEELYRQFDKIKMGYDANEVASHDDMQKFYTKEQQQKYGVVGIEIR